MLKKFQSTQELDKLEEERRARLQAIEDEIAALGEKRREAQMRLGGGDEGAKKEVQQIAASISELQEEADSVRAYLETIPNRREYARGVELESLPGKIQKMKSKLPGLADNVEEKAKELRAAIDAYGAALGNFDDFSETVSLGLEADFVWQARQHQRFMVHSSISGLDDAPEISFLGAMVLNPEAFSGWKNQVEDALQKRIADIAAHSRILTGKDERPGIPGFCPRCYSKKIVWSDYSKSYDCKACNHDFKWPTTIKD